MGLLRSFMNGKSLGEIAEPKQGLATGNNDKFLRFWFEVGQNNVFYDATDYINAFASGKKWFPCNKGGTYRKWYGNNERFIDWLADGQEIKSFNGSVIRNSQYYFQEGGTWSTLASNNFSMRYSPKGFIFESKGSVCFAKNEDELCYIIGLLNTKVINQALLVLSPTLDYHEGPLSRVPVLLDNSVKNQVDCIVKENIFISKKDWDSFENSWDFKKHPLI